MFIEIKRQLSMIKSSKATQLELLPDLMTGLKFLVDSQKGRLREKSCNRRLTKEFRLVLRSMLLVAVHRPIIFRTAPCRSEPNGYTLQTCRVPIYNEGRFSVGLTTNSPPLCDNIHFLKS